jgi:hypothetical protein
MANRVREAFKSSVYEVRSYSGRGMYGKSCLGVVCDSPVDAILDAIIEFVAGNTDQDTTIEFIDELRNYRIDDLGLSTILYFPYIEWEDDQMIDEDENIKENE